LAVILDFGSRILELESKKTQVTLKNAFIGIMDPTKIKVRTQIQPVLY